MLLTPEMCRAARALLNWETPQLAASAELSREVVERFEAGGMVEPASVEVMLEALQGAGLEFIPAGGTDELAHIELELVEKPIRERDSIAAVARLCKASPELR